MCDPSIVFNFVVVACIGVLRLLSIVWYVEYLMRDMAAPESIRALEHLPVWTVIVGQSMISATVTWSLEDSLPCSWESLLGETSISLKDLIPLPSHWSDHHCCSNQCTGLLSSPSCSSWDVAFLSFCWSMNLICMSHALKIGRIVVSVTYCDLRINNLKSCNVWMIYNVTDVVCHGKVCGCVLFGLGEIIMSYFCSGCIYLGVVI